MAERWDEVVGPPPHISLAQLEAAETAYDLGLKFDGCPCFAATVDGQEVEGHCWRVCPQCDHCGLHAGVPTPAVTRLKVLLDKMDWYGEWSLRFDGETNGGKR